MAEPHRGPPLARWAMLLAGSVLLGGLLDAIGLPAGLLIGPMLTSIVLAVQGRGVTVPPVAFAGAQAVVGCLIAGSMTPAIVQTVIGHWPLFLGTTLLTVLASVLLGYAIARFGWLPGSVAVWGSTPGAASAMVLMARDAGAEWRLVAVMVYARVVCVAAVASLVSVLLAPHGQGAGPNVWLASPTLETVAVTIATGVAGAVLGRLLRLPAGPLLGTLVLGSILNIAGVVRIALPEWLLAISYAILGWRIGANFTREVVSAAARALPHVLLSIAILIAFSAALGVALSRVAGIDPVTAYLATSPGGMDSVAIIAASSPVDVPYVMALQLLRFLLVLVVGPLLARTVAKRYAPSAAAD